MKKGIRSIDSIMDGLKGQGYHVAYYGAYPQGIVYRIANTHSSALRFTHQLEKVLDGGDMYFNSTRL